MRSGPWPGFAVDIRARGEVTNWDDSRHKAAIGLSAQGGHDTLTTRL